jgi:outer membrane protein
MKRGKAGLNIRRGPANLDPRVERNRAGLVAMGLLLTLVAGRAAGQEPPLPLAPGAEPAVDEAGTEDQQDDAITGPAPGVPTLSLGAIVALALERNFSLLDQADSVSAAGFRVGVARAQFLPQLTPTVTRTSDGASYGLDVAQKLPWSGATVEGVAAFTSNEQSGTPVARGAAATLLLRQPLLRGAGPNATYYDLTNSRRAKQTQERSYELGRQRLAIQATSGFYNVIAQRQLLTVSRQSLKRSQSLLKASEARLKVGLASKLDVFRAELQAAQTEDALVRSQAALESALEQLRSLLALPPGDPVEPPAVSLMETITTEPEPLEALVLRALENRIELQEARDQVADSRRSLSLAKQNLLPQLDATLAVTRLGGGPSYSEAWNASDTRAALGFTTSYPLERSADKANRAIAELDLTSRQRALHQRELDTEGEVRSAVRELLRIRKSVDLQKQAVAVAAQQRRLATLRYERGLASNFDVVDAEGSLVLARSALVGLLASYKVAEIELKRATGTLDVATEFSDKPGAPAPGSSELFGTPFGRRLEVGP